MAREMGLDWPVAFDIAVGGEINAPKGFSAALVALQTETDDAR
jgi:hypothetical protein